MHVSHRLGAPISKTPALFASRVEVFAAPASNANLRQCNFMPFRQTQGHSKMPNQLGFFCSSLGAPACQGSPRSWSKGSLWRLLKTPVGRPDCERRTFKRKDTASRCNRDALSFDTSPQSQLKGFADRSNKRYPAKHCRSHTSQFPESDLLLHLRSKLRWPSGDTMAVVQLLVLLGCVAFAASLGTGGGRPLNWGFDES